MESRHSVQSTSVSYGGIGEIQKDVPNSRQRDTIEDFYDAGLDKATYVDPEVRTIPRTRLVRKMGELSEYDREKFGL